MGWYLLEAAGSVHTLHVPPDNVGDTDGWFVINGALPGVFAEMLTGAGTGKVVVVP